MTHVLLVDDNQFVRTCIDRMLKNENFMIETAENGVEALSKLKSSTPDVIICDVKMPQMDGYRFVKTLKAMETLRHIPVIMYTSMQEKRERKKFMTLGVACYLDKCCPPETLINTISGLFV